MTRVGVLLPPPQTDLGEWLASGAAFDAAGADALWLDAGPELDPVALTAALAAMTFRALLVAPIPAGTPARTRETLDRLSRGRLRILSGGAAHHLDGTPEPGRWTPIQVPPSRDEWRKARSEAAEHDLLVPADARLLDLLRNPDDPGSRRDLELSVG